MGVNNRSFVAGAGGKFPTAAFQVLTISRETQIGNSQADFEVGSTRLPSDSDWQLVSAHVWARAVTSDPTAELLDDGTAITDAVDIVAGAQTEITFTGPVRLAGGSELQLEVNTDSGDDVTDVQVTIVIRPYPLAEAGVAVS